MHAVTSGGGRNVRKKRALVDAAAMVAVVLLLGLGPETTVAEAAAVAKAAPLIANTELDIYDPSGATLLGKANYTVTQRGGLVKIEGRNDFVDGQRDVEHDTLRSVDGGLPRMVTYEHDFFDAHGVPQIVAKADAVTGQTSCAKYENGSGTIQTDTLEFPPDTYAGAGVLVPVADQFRHGQAADLDIHVFDCAHGPRILSLHVDLARAPWGLLPHEGALGKAEAHPVFGWFNVFLKPFVPTIRLWFDPLRDFAFVGGTLARYYRGPEVLLVNVAPAVKPEPAFVRPESPVITVPHHFVPPARSSSAGVGSTGAAATPSDVFNSAAERAAPEGTVHAR